MGMMRKRKDASKNQMAGGCLALFGLPFLLAGLALSVFYFSGYVKWWQARSWVEVPCVIDSTELKESRGDDSTTYRVQAAYHYEFQGRPYHSEQVTFGKGSDNVGDFQHTAHRELSHYQDGRRFRCFVDPNHPENAVLYRGLRWEMQAFMAIFALTFPAVGAGLVVGGIMGGRVMKREAVLKESHPQEAWKWKEAWAGATIPERSGGLGRAFDLYTLWAALVIFPLLWAAGASGAFATDSKAMLLGIFFVLWCIPAGFTLRRLRKWRVLGRTRVELAEMPGWPGGRLAGSVLLEKPLPVFGDSELILTCDKLTTRSSGDGTSTTREQIWQETQCVPRDGVTRDLAGYRVPFEMSLPADAPVTGGDDGIGVKHEWTLRLQLPSSKMSAVFEVPVFNTGKQPLVEVAQSTPTLRDSVAIDLPERLAARKLRVEFAPDGTPSTITCPPARNLSMIGFLFVFNLLWTGAAVLLVVKEAPLLFRIVWIGSATAIWCSIIYQLIHRRQVSFDASEVVIANRLGPWTRTARMGKSEITGFNQGVTSSSGNTQFHRVRLEDVYGRKMTVADNITESATAEELVRRLEAWWKRA
ncbi:MAG: DUF3592 domain-containing protein [Verrucomicrobiota bacterium]